MSQIYNIYFDESSIDNPDNQFMVIGGVFVNRNKVKRIIAEIKSIKKRHEFYGEIKWTKTDANKIKFLKELIDYTMSLKPSDLSFHYIVINKGQVDYARYHDNDKELAFYKFMYALIKKRLRNNYQYYIFLDFKPTSKERISKLHSFLQNYIYFNKENCQIKHLQPYDSKENILLQIADFYCGAIGYHHNEFPEGSPKDEICKYIAAKMGAKSLNFCTPPHADKFNIFCIELL